MTEEQKELYFAEYNRRTHTVGRIGLGLGLIMLLAAPFAMGLVLDAMPSMNIIKKSLLQIAIVYVPSCVVEFLIYTPMLGAGGSYLAFITGNLVNMKLPCVNNAKDLTGARVGTAENEIVSTLAIATSTLVTTLVIAAGVILLIPLRPVLESPVLQPAFNNVVPALFGAMAFQYFRKDKRLVALPLVIMTVLFMVSPGLISSVGTLLIISGAVTIAQAWILFRRDEKKAQSGKM